MKNQKDYEHINGRLRFVMCLMLAIAIFSFFGFNIAGQMQYSVLDKLDTSQVVKITLERRHNNDFKVHVVKRD